MLAPLLMLLMAGDWVPILVPPGGGNWKVERRGQMVATMGPRKPDAPVSMITVVDLGQGSPADHACLLEEVERARSAMVERGGVLVGAFDPPPWRPGQPLQRSRYRHLPFAPGATGMIWNPRGGPACGDKVKMEEDGDPKLRQVNALPLIASLKIPKGPLAVIWVANGFQDWSELDPRLGRDAMPSIILDQVTMAGISVFPVLVGGDDGDRRRAQKSAALFGGRVFKTVAEAIAYIDSMEVLEVQAIPDREAAKKIEPSLELKRAGLREDLRRAWHVARDGRRGGVSLPGVLNGIARLIGGAQISSEDRACPAEEGVNRFLSLRLPRELAERMRSPLRAEFEYLAEDAKLSDDGPFLGWGTTPPQRMDFKQSSAGLQNVVYCIPVRSPFPGRRYRLLLLDGGGDWVLVAEGRFGAIP